ncbi:ATP-binding cassette domain-containing protein [Tateyamaria omphalii]|uniref:ABC transporter ATP-binding protein n=1 Tax=Tateyamaria omphalii TaxID=299262 RepID=A0A1P8MS71_9RHOB|nr:ATP-binding cassette domain-containing protein [Tateyamaria omphalii]APX10926.1 ABC transporter ATP-binding protein [Tateyamaria omphalii]
MTEKRPFTLTITNGNQAQITAAPSKEAPKADNTNHGADHEADRLRARADVAVAYAGLLGVSAATSDMLTTLRQNAREGASDKVEAGTLATCLRGTGLQAQVMSARALTPEHWPALAYMTSGQVVLVVGQDRGDLIIYDKTCPDNRAHVPLAEFVPFFAGHLVKAEAPLERVAETHKTFHVSNHWFWGQFPRFRKALAEIALGSFVANLLAVAVALFSLQVYDRVIPHQSEATLWVLAAGACLALLLEAFIKIARARLMDGAGRQIELSVLTLLMQRVMGMRSDLRGQSPSMTFSAMREFGSVREFFTASTIGTIADIPFIFVFLLLVASIAGPVVWVLILGGILMVVPGFFMQRRMLRLTQETQGASAKSSRLLHEAIFERDTVKTQRAEDRVMRLWQELTTLSAMKSSEQRRLASALTFWSQGMQQMTYVAAVIAGTYLVFAGQFTVGSIIAVGILSSRTLAPLTQLAGTMARWGNVKAALDGLDAIADAPQDVDASRTYLRRDTLKGHFELREVQFQYEDDGAPTLDLPGVQILPGQRLAVLGSNGAGKSSLLKLLSGVYAPTKGRVLIDGTDMAQIEPRDLRRLIGYLGQDVRLFSGTLRDNLNLTLLERDDDRLYAALDFAGLGPFVKGHHKGLDLEILDGGQGLSIGQRQSIGWARLWLQDPAICLLDEPTAALDQTLETTLVSRLETWMQGRTAIIATHRVPILSLTNRTLILQNGRMTIDGPRDEVLSHIGKTVPLKGKIA